MKAPSEIVKNLLVTAGAGVYGDATATWPLYVSSEPEAPDQVLTVYDDDTTHGDALRRSFPVWGQAMVQIRVRCNDYVTGYTKAIAVLRSLAGTAAFVQAATATELLAGEHDIRYHSFGVVNGPNYIGKDESGRCLFTGNIRVSKEELL